MDCICLKRKHRKNRDQRKFRPLSPGVSPAHSQPSTLGHAVQDGRLPKVNSTGLWIGAPSLYSAAPSQAYFYGRPPGSKGHRDDRPLHIPRAASETRLPQPKHSYTSSRPVYGSHNNVYLLPLHPGAQRFYHSQQLAPVFEVPPSTGMEIYDVYQFGGGYGSGPPRSKLLETKHSPHYYNNVSSHNNHNLTGQFRLSSRGVERSKSDAQDRPSPRREHQHKRHGSRQNNGSAHENRAKAGSREKLASESWASEEARRKRASKSLESLRENGAAVPVIPAGATTGSSGASSRARSDIRPPSVHSSSEGAHVNAGFASSLERHQSTKTSNAPAPAAPTSATAMTGSPTVNEPATLPNGTPGIVSTYVHGSHSSNKSSGRSTTTSSNNAHNTTTPSITPSATDSMKLLHKNKTDDQKQTTAAPALASITVDQKKQDGKEEEDNLGSPLHYHRYEYGGDIYTIPSKGIISEGEDEYDNPIVNRMKQMVLEKSRSNPASPRSESVNMTTSSSFQDGVYEEVTKITKVTRSEVIESVEPEIKSSAVDSGISGGNSVGNSSSGGQNTVDLLDGLVLPDILESDKQQKKQPPVSSSSQNLSTASSSATTALSHTTTTVTAEKAAAVGTITTAGSGATSPSSPTVLRPKEALSPRASSDNAEDINKAGKRITASAFEFLEQYLSDDEGTETSHVDSPPLSPTGIKGLDLVY